MLYLRNILWITRVLPSSERVPTTALFRHYHKSARSSENDAPAKTSRQTTVNEEEVRKFQELAQKWWSKEFHVLFLMNTLRVPFVQDGILQAHSVQRKGEEKPLTGFRIIDVGCGGGILAEPLARLGAQVTGLDPGEQNIKAAQYHCSSDAEIRDNLEYICSTVEVHSKENKKYNAVVCSEVIEHVDNVPLFVKCCVDLVENGGSVFFTTISRTTFSYIYAILLAEHVFGFIPKGTHDWNKFIKPEELTLMLEPHGCKTISVRGMSFNPFLKRFSWKPYQGCFYALHAVKEGVTGSLNT